MPNREKSRAPHRRKERCKARRDWTPLRPINEWWIAKAARRFLNLVVEGWGCLGDTEKPEIFWNFLLYYYRRGCEED
jgi:hypothetical protein